MGWGGEWGGGGVRTDIPTPLRFFLLFRKCSTSASSRTSCLDPTSSEGACLASTGANRKGTKTSHNNMSQTLCVSGIGARCRILGLFHTSLASVLDVFSVCVFLNPFFSFSYLRTCVFFIFGVCRFKFDAMNAVTGAYAKPIFVDVLGASPVSPNSGPGSGPGSGSYPWFLGFRIP